MLANEQWNESKKKWTGINNYNYVPPRMKMYQMVNMVSLAQWYRWHVKE